ncbi:MAG: glycosyltransferase family 39 protein [Leifsonia sp.]
MTTGSIDVWQTQPAVAELPGVAKRIPPAAVVGVIATGISWAASWIPSFWGDEAASVMSAERPIPSLIAELGRIDAVHGLYYLFLHGWIGAFGASELSVRLPSAIAVGIAAAGVVTLASRFAGLRVAVLAGLVFSVLPRVTAMGDEARSYAMQAAVAVWLMVWFLHLLRGRDTRPRAWLAYGVVLGLSAYLFLYLLLLTAVQVAAVLLAARGTRPQRAGTRRLVVAASSVAVIVALPILVIADRQKEQIAFLARRDYATAYSVLVDQWFGWVPLAVLCWLLVGCALAATFLCRRRPASAAASTRRDGVVLALAWLVLPTALLLLLNGFVTPLYNVRYLSFVTPAVAILIAIGLAAVPELLGRVSSRPLRAATLAAELLVIVAVVAAPAYLMQRTPFAKDGGSDWREVATAVRAEARPGDPIVFDQATKPSQRPRLAMRLYPQDFAAVRDVALATPFARRAGLWDAVHPVSALGHELAGVQRVLAVELRTTAQPADIRSLRRDGFQVTDVDHLHRTDLYTLTREQS